MFSEISNLPDNANILLPYGLSWTDPEDLILDLNSLEEDGNLPTFPENDLFPLSQDNDKNSVIDHNTQLSMSNWFDDQPQNYEIDLFQNQLNQTHQEYYFDLFERDQTSDDREPEGLSDETTKEDYTGKFSPTDEELSSELSQKTVQKVSSKKIQKQSKNPIHKVIKEGAAKKKNQTSKLEFKNVVKNYGKAMATFSLSETAIPYLHLSLSSHKVTMEDFRSFMINQKESIECIGALRHLLYVNPDSDNPEEEKLKSVFRDISEVFVRDFAVNWIFSSKIKKYKSQHLECRFKILRRVRDPINFTYLKSK